LSFTRDSSRDTHQPDHADQHRHQRKPEINFVAVLRFLNQRMGNLLEKR